MIDVRREIKEDIVFVMKAKTLIQSAPPKQRYFKDQIVVFN